MAFAELGLTSVLVETVQQLGYDQPTPIQQQAIPAILAGEDVMAGAQTGTGKTAAFTLPMIHQLLANLTSHSDIRALVLAPTRELAQQVHKSLQSYAQATPLKSALLYGGVSVNVQVAAVQQGVDIVVATPGRLLDLINQGVVDLSSLETLVFDEADRLLDMGFMDDINRILKTVPDARQTLLFSATFDDAIFKLSKRLQNKPQLIEVDQRNTTASRVEQTFYTVDPERKRELISHLIGARNWHQVLVFTRTKQGADALAAEMVKDGLVTEAIHGDRSQGARERVLEQFREGKVRVLVATDVAARGLDIPQLAYVINHQLPFNAEDYVHRIGRTGRAGASGIAISLVSEEENYLLRQLEELLDTAFVPQWMPGYEPDLERVVQPSRRNNGKQSKRNVRKKALAASAKGGNKRR